MKLFQTKFLTFHIRLIFGKISGFKAGLEQHWQL